MLDTKVSLTLSVSIFYLEFRQTQLLERRHGEHSMSTTTKSSEPIVHV